MYNYLFDVAADICTW